MSSTELQTQSQNFKRYVKISLIAHGLVFLALTIQMTLFTSDPIQFEKAIRVDMVGLPDKIMKAPPAPAPVAKPEPPKPEPVKEVAKEEPVKPKAIPKPVVKDPEAINLNKTKAKEKLALEKLRQMEALEKIQKSMEAEKQKNIIAAASKVKFKGNVLSAGSELTGVNKLLADNYTNDVYHHILDYWTAPAYFKNRNLKTHVMVRFDERGNVISKEIVKSSGNPAFDDLVLSAIQKSSPVPPPPAKFSKIASVEGFLFRFTPDSD